MRLDNMLEEKLASLNYLSKGKSWREEVKQNTKTKPAIARYSYENREYYRNEVATNKNVLKNVSADDLPKLTKIAQSRNLDMLTDSNVVENRNVEEILQLSEKVVNHFYPSRIHKLVQNKCILENRTGDEHLQMITRFEKILRDYYDYRGREVICDLAYDLFTNKDVLLIKTHDQFLQLVDKIDEYDFSEFACRIAISKDVLENRTHEEQLIMIDRRMNSNICSAFFPLNTTMLDKNILVNRDLNGQLTLYNELDTGKFEPNQNVYDVIINKDILENTDIDEQMIMVQNAKEITSREEFNKYMSEILDYCHSSNNESSRKQLVYKR